VAERMRKLRCEGQRATDRRGSGAGDGAGDHRHTQMASECVMISLAFCQPLGAKDTLRRFTLQGVRTSQRLASE